MTVDPLQVLSASSEVSCQKLLEKIPHLAWLMSERGDILSVNKWWSEYIGRSSGARSQLGEDSCDHLSEKDVLVPRICLCVRTFADILHETERDRFESLWTAAIRAQEPLEIKLRLTSTVGDWEWFQVELEPDRDRSGTTTWIGTAMRLGGEAAIPGRQQSVHFLEALLAHASDAIVACDNRGRLVLFNRMAQRFHGLPPEPLLPEEWASYYDLYDGDGIKPLLKEEIPLFRALQGEAVVDREMTIAPKDGIARLLLANATAIYSNRGEKLGAVALMRDLTAYKQAMTDLQLSERKFRAIFNGVFQFIGLTELDGTLLEANQTALNFGGIEASEAIGRRFWEVPAWKFSPAVQQQLQAATERAAQGEFFRCRVELTGAIDRTIPIDFSLTPIRDRCGEVTMLIAEGRDLSQIEQANIERTHAQANLERLSISLQVGRAGAWTWNLVNDKIFWTQEAELLLDYEPGTTEQVYSEWLDRIHPDDVQRAESALQATADGTCPEYRCEYRIVRRNGEIRWLDAIGEVHADENGCQWMSGLISDITERKFNEEALRRSEEFQRRILESNNDCIKVFDLAGRLLYMNHGGLSRLEIEDFATIANKDWRELWPVNEAENIERALDLARAGNRDEFEGFCPTATGQPKWWEVIVTPILDADGRVDRILGVSRDITERRDAAAVLQASEELFRHTFEFTPMGFAHATPDGRLTRVNRKFCEICGYSSEELLTLSFQDITDPEDLSEEMALVEKLFTNEIQEYTLEKRYIHKQGHHVWVSLTVSLVREIVPEGQLGAPSYFLSAIQDITHRKQLELTNQHQTTELQYLNSSLLLTQHQLHERNEELDSFVRIASHDLKAPLRAIANLAEWIEEDITDRLSEDERQQFELLRQRVHRMSALIDGLLRYSRLGRQDLATETVDVSQLIAETIDSIDPPVGFKIEIVSPLPTLAAKRILLSQVFANLLSNAIKHHQCADGQVEISAKDCGEYYQFSIADDGPGIPAGEDRERIFEIFQTLKPSNSTENTGIGLAVVKKIVEGEGGRIWLDNDRDRGACFCFTWIKAVE